MRRPSARSMTGRPATIAGLALAIALAWAGATAQADDDTDRTDNPEETDDDTEAPEPADHPSGFDTGALADDATQEDALTDWRDASRRQAQARVRRGTWMAGGGAVAAAGAIYFGVATARASRRLNETIARRDEASSACTQAEDDDDPACMDERQYDAQAARLSQRASVSLAIGAALGVTGATLAFVGAHDIVTGHRMRTELAVGPDSAFLQISTRF